MSKKTIHLSFKPLTIHFSYNRDAETHCERVYYMKLMTRLVYINFILIRDKPTIKRIKYTWNAKKSFQMQKICKKPIFENIQIYFLQIKTDRIKTCDRWWLQIFYTKLHLNYSSIFCIHHFGMREYQDAKWLWACVFSNVLFDRLCRWWTIF